MTDLQAAFNVALASLSNFYGDAVKAQNFSGVNASSSKPGSKVLMTPPDARAILDEWRFRWKMAKDDRGRRQVVKDVQAECIRIQRHVAPEVKFDGKRYWLLESGQYHGVDYRTAAADLSLEEQTVWEWRKQRGVDERSGREKKSKKSA